MAGLILVAALQLAAGDPVSPALDAQWADLPDYRALLHDQPHFQSPPRLISGSPPPAPSFLTPGSSTAVSVIIAINERGEVVAARVEKSDDPRLNPIAIEAIQHWKFAPAQDGGGPIKFVVRMPLDFEGPLSADQNQLVFSLGDFSYDTRGLDLYAPLQLLGPAASRVKAGRIVITSAIDDTNTNLASSLMPMSVGSGNASPQLSVHLRKPAPSATRLRTLGGSVELVVPSLDPDAVVDIDQLPTKLGRAVASPLLAAAGVTIIVLDHKLAQRALANADDPSGAHDFLTITQSGSNPGLRIPAGVPQMTDAHLAIAIDDPNERLAGIELQSLYGQSLPYEHNDWSHYKSAPGKRVSIYQLNTKLSDDIKLVCWLVTPNSLFKYPFEYTDVPLPPLSVKSGEPRF